MLKVVEKKIKRARQKGTYHVLSWFGQVCVNVVVGLGEEVVRQLHLDWIAAALRVR